MRQFDETFRLQVDFDPATAERSFRIAASETIEIMLLGRVIPAMLAEAPGIDVQVIGLDHADVARAFDLGADMIALPERLADARFHSFPLMAATPSCMIWDQHPSIGRSISESQYLSLPHVAVHDPLWPSLHLDSHARLVLSRRRVRVRTGLHAALPGLLIGSELIATASDWLLQHQASTMPLRVINAPFTTTPDSIVVQWPAHCDGDPANRWLLGHMEAATRTFWKG